MLLTPWGHPPATFYAVLVSFIFPCVLRPKETRNISDSKPIALKEPPVFQRECLNPAVYHQTRELLLPVPHCNDNTV